MSLVEKPTLFCLCAEAGHVEEGGVVEEEPVGEAGLVVLAQPPVLKLIEVEDDRYVAEL